MIRCFLDSAGSVARAEVVSGHPLLKDQSLENVLLWKFERSTLTPDLTTSVTLKYQYRLDPRPDGNGRTSFVLDLPNVIQIAFQIPTTDRE